MCQIYELPTQLWTFNNKSDVIIDVDSWTGAPLVRRRVRRVTHGQRFCISKARLWIEKRERTNATFNQGNTTPGNEGGPRVLFVLRWRKCSL